MSGYRMTDFPKIQCPFVRREFAVNKEDWKKHGKALQLRQPKVYLVVNQVNPGYEWVFDNIDTVAIEKLDGTNVKVDIQHNKLMQIQNRKNSIEFGRLDDMKGHLPIIEGVFRAIAKGYIKEDGQYAGEVIGPKVQGNPYQLESCIWFPFDKAYKELYYKSFHEHDRTFDNWSFWFKNYLFSRFFDKKTKKGSSSKIFAEGVVFYTGMKMAKLRRDMFDWYYNDKIEIYGYDPDPSKCKPID